jgi:hypothetical protein
MSNISVTGKARSLIKTGNVAIDDVSANEMQATVITTDETGIPKDHHVIVWRDGRFSCTCENFLYSKSESLDLWAENLRVKPECKHALAVKLDDSYKQWIRMVIVPTNEGYALRSIEAIEIITVKSLDEKISKERMLPKKAVMSPRAMRPRINFDDIFRD